MVSPKKYERFMQEALSEARQALDQGEFPVGCVFVENEKIVARGRRVNSSQANQNEIDHAEIITLRTLLESNKAIDPAEITVYSTMEPCLMCYATMLLSGIRCFVWAYEDVMGGGTNLPLDTLRPLYAEMQVECVGNICRQESLLLFQEFFQRYSYWQDSFLADYTLKQPSEKTSL